MTDVSKAAEEAAGHAARLVLYARQWLDGALAQDVVQEALVSLLSQRERPRDTLAWMYRAVRNGAIDTARSAGRLRRREQEFAAMRAGWFEGPAGAGMEIDAAAAQGAMENLPREMREIVVLRIWGELGFVQIAEIVQMSVGTVHSRFGEAMTQMRASLNR